MSVVGPVASAVGRDVKFTGGDGPLPELRLHLDGSDYTTMLSTAGTQPFGLGTSPIPDTNGGQVGCWKDLSGNDHHMNQDDGGRRPEYFKNIQNGLSAMYSPGSDASFPWKFYATSSVLTSNESYTAMYTASIAANETLGVVWCPTNTASIRTDVRIDSRNVGRGAGSLVDATGSGVATMPSDIAGGAFHQITVVKEGDTISCRLDGVDGTPFSTGGDGAFTNDYTRIFAGIGESGNFIGHVGELKVWGGVLTASQIATEEAALKAKWATP